MDGKASLLYKVIAVVDGVREEGYVGAGTAQEAVDKYAEIGGEEIKIIEVARIVGNWQQPKLDKFAK